MWHILGAARRPVRLRRLNREEVGELSRYPKGHIRSLPVIPSVMGEPWEGFESETDQF